MEVMKCIQRFNQIILQILSEVIIGAILALFGLGGGGGGEGKAKCYLKTQHQQKSF